MTAKNLKKSPGKSGTHAIHAGRYTPLKTAQAALSPSMSSLVALNRIYVIEEDGLGIADTGLSGSVEQAIRTGALVIPDAYQDFATKYPCTGKVIAKGNKTRYEEVQVGTQVMFARLGVQRYKLNGKTYCNCLEEDLHLVFN